MIGMAALLLLAMSCKKNEEKPLGGEVCFHASIETPSGTGKTHLADNGHTVLWDANDAITVVNGQETPVAWDFTVVNISEDGKTADFVSDEHGVPEGFFTPDYKAYYPASMYDKSTGKVSLPSEQVYKAGSFYPGYNPMAAQSDDENLYFKNICGVLMLQLTGRCTVDNITITSRGESKLWGTAEITMEDDKYDEAMTPTLGTLEGGGKTLTLKCNNAVTLKPDEATAFYFVLPPGSLSDGFEVKVTQSNGDVWTRATSADISIEASHIKKMKEQNVIVVPEGALSGLFSVGPGPDNTPNTDDDDKVYFSKGNLQFNTTTKEWRLAENQWDMCDTEPETTGGHHPSKGYEENSGEWIDLFGWGTSGYQHGATCFQPWDTRTTTSYYYAYGSSDKNLYDGDGDDKGMADWGMANSISNGGNTKKMWRTLNQEEWEYLIKTRNVQGETGQGHTCVFVTLENGVKGVVFFHDDYIGNTVNLTSIPDGCLFVPHVGTRTNKETSRVNSGGYYWSSSYCTTDISKAYRVRMVNGYVYGVGDTGSRNLGHSVRLAMDAD